MLTWQPGRGRAATRQVVHDGTGPKVSECARSQRSHHVPSAVGAFPLSAIKLTSPIQAQRRRGGFRSGARAEVIRTPLHESPRFSIQALSTVGLTWHCLVSASPRAPVEGTNYVKLSQRAPTSAPAGKVEVVEFFWYGCPHCNHFEPYLAAWLAKLPADVSFRRVPVAFRENPFGIHQRMYFAVEAMGLLATPAPQDLPCHSRRPAQARRKPELIKTSWPNRRGCRQVHGDHGVFRRQDQGQPGPRPGRCLQDRWRARFGHCRPVLHQRGPQWQREEHLATVDYLVNRARSGR